MKSPHWNPRARVMPSHFLEDQTTSNTRAGSASIDTMSVAPSLFSRWCGRLRAAGPELQHTVRPATPPHQLQRPHQAFILKERKRPALKPSERRRQRRRPTPPSKMSTAVWRHGNTVMYSSEMAFSPAPCSRASLTRCKGIRQLKFFKRAFMRDSRRARHAPPRCASSGLMVTLAKARVADGPDASLSGEFRFELTF